MNRNRRGAKARRQMLRLWTYQQALTALPYVSSVVRSLREHWLEMQRYQDAFRRLEKQTGRPDRTVLIAQQEARHQADEASNRFEQALEELQSLDIYCLDPNRGEALIPFVQGEQLAWYVYDLFEEPSLGHWRFHSDPFETRRPIKDAVEGREHAMWTG